MKEILAEIIIAVEMAQGKTWNNVQMAGFKADLFIGATNISFPLFNIIDAEIGTYNIGVIPLFVQFHMLNMQ